MIFIIMRHISKSFKHSVTRALHFTRVKSINFKHLSSGAGKSSIPAGSNVKCSRKISEKLG